MTGISAKAVQLLTEAQDRSSLLFLRNSGRKTASHFSWNCSEACRAKVCSGFAPKTCGKQRSKVWQANLKDRDAL
ncbi:hypothetical protein ELG97_21960 [Rhizobium leguminosarum]|nr:hypothetical protein ELG97_21960 [Rhizobium leguminosarum]